MYEFQISAPASLNLFGEHTKNILRTSIDLRTMINFQIYSILSSNDSIEIDVPQINIVLKKPLHDFREFYNYYVTNKKLNTQMSLFTGLFNSDQKKVLQIFYYLLVYIIYEERIEIKPFSIHLHTLPPNEKFIPLASLKVCIAACLLHWSRLQKGIQNNFDATDLEKIYTYAMSCKDIQKISKLDEIDIIVCTYGTMVRYDMEQKIRKSLYLPMMTILLVDSKQTHDIEALNQRVIELKSMLPDATNFILNGIDIITNMIADTFQIIIDTYKNNELSVEMIKNCLLLQHQALEVNYIM